MTTLKRVEFLESKINVSDKETVFETQTLRGIQTRLKREKNPTPALSLAEIQKKVSAIS